MASFKFQGNKVKGGIPTLSRVRIEALPGRNLVQEYDNVKNGYILLELDPGKYAYSVAPGSKHDVQLGGNKIVYSDEFFFEISEEAWKAMQKYQPQLVKTIHTSEGVVWRCKHPFCTTESTSTTAALLHELEHFGVDRDAFLKDPDAATAMAAQNSAQEVAAKIASAQAAQGKKFPTL